MKNRNLAHKDDWATPKPLYEELNKEFSFEFDPCLDPLILPAVKVLNENGFDTFESCQGGEGHCCLNRIAANIEINFEALNKQMKMLPQFLKTGSADR